MRIRGFISQLFSPVVLGAMIVLFTQVAHGSPLDWQNDLTGWFGGGDTRGLWHSASACCG